MSADDLLVKPLEHWFSQHYPKAKRDGIVKRFSTLHDAQLVTLYDKAIEGCKRLPELPDLLSIYDQTRVQAKFQSTGQGASSGTDAVVAKATKDSHAYADRLLANEPEWRLAVTEGWGLDARKFLQCWAYNQSILIQGLNNVGVDKSTMLGSPPSDAEYYRRLEEMKSTMVAAKQSGNIFVHCPYWLVEYGRKQAQRKTENPIVSTPKRLIEQTAQSLMTQTA